MNQDSKLTEVPVDVSPLTDAFYRAKTLASSECGEPGARWQLFGRRVVPFEKGSEEYFWFVLLSSRGHLEDSRLISHHTINHSQTPREECELQREALSTSGYDVQHVLDDAAEERVLSLVQVCASTHFLDKQAYKGVQIKESRFIHYVATHRLQKRVCEVPKFLGYDMLLFTNSDASCVELKAKDSKVRNQPATLLILGMKTLTPDVEVYGKSFAIADGRDLTPDEVREMVIFCMGQAEALELKLTSWDKLKATLQDEAKKFAASAQFLRR